jgi:hypothetical protein
MMHSNLHQHTYKMRYKGKEMNFSERVGWTIEELPDIKSQLANGNKMTLYVRDIQTGRKLPYFDAYYFVERVDKDQVFHIWLTNDSRRSLLRELVRWESQSPTEERK